MHRLPICLAVICPPPRASSVNVTSLGSALLADELPVLLVDPFPRRLVAAFAAAPLPLLRLPPMDAASSFRDRCPCPPPPSFAPAVLAWAACCLPRWTATWTRRCPSRILFTAAIANCAAWSLLLHVYMWQTATLWPVFRSNSRTMSTIVDLFECACRDRDRYITSEVRARQPNNTSHQPNNTIDGLSRECATSRCHTGGGRSIAH